MKLSIIVPVYNVEKYVGQCLKSLYSTNVDENLYEVIVVNDGTQDNSMMIAETIAKTHANIRLINQKNGGLSAARNAGLSVAQGQYVWFVDSDDWLCDDAVNRVLYYLSIYDDLDIITSPLYWSYEDNHNNRIDLAINEDKILSGMELLQSIGSLGAIQRNIIKKDLLDKYKICFYPGILHEDALFEPQIYYPASKVLVVSKYFYNYRQRTEGSIMHTIKIKSAYDLIIVHQQLMEYCDTIVSSEHRIWFRKYYIGILAKSILFTWHLRESSDFQRFLKDTKKYRKKQYFRLIKHSDMRYFIKSICMVYWPVQYFKIKRNK